MLTSEPRQAYVWIWLPEDTDPTPCGVIAERKGRYSFQYGTQYLANPKAISLFEKTLPLRRGWIDPLGAAPMALNLRDAAPDAWGRRVILDRLAGRDNIDRVDLSELTYMMESDSNRIGALDFQQRPDVYIPRGEEASLEDLFQAARSLDEGQPLSDQMRAVLASGTGIGGARPKATLRDGGREVIAKFSTSTDILPVVPAESASMFLADKVGLRVPRSEVVEVAGRRVLIMDRFDRPGEGQRRLMVSALAITQDEETFRPQGGYLDILDGLNTYSDGTDYGPELFERIAFNIAVTNTDDHLRNHSAFWNGQALSLTPAYDLAPGARSGDTAYLALAYSRDGQRQATFQSLIKESHEYGLTDVEAKDFVDRIIGTMNDSWNEAADHAHMTRTEQDLLWERQFLHPATGYGMDRGTGMVSALDTQKSGYHWVGRHMREGKPVTGHWAKNPSL